MGFLGFRWGSFPHFFSKKCWSRFFFSVGFMVDFRGHTGRWHSQWSLGWWTTKHWKGFPNCSWSEQGFLQLFFFFCGGGQLSYDLATLKQMVQANLVMLKFQSPQPGPHCTLMISLKRLGNKRNKLSLYLVEWACPELRRACWGFAGLHLEFYICACIYIYKV